MVGIAVAFCLQVSFAVAGHLELQIDCRCLFPMLPAAGGWFLHARFRQINPPALHPH